jgi:DNA-damage-inducible protein D
MGTDDKDLTPEFVHKTLEDIKRTDAEGVEFWSARELMDVLGYGKWDNFVTAIAKAKVACEQAGHKASDHITDAGKMIETGKGAQRIVEDFHLTRYACYLIAQNGDSRKTQIALAQTYFATQTRRQELLDQMTDLEKRKELRNRVKDHNKALSSAAQDAGVQPKMFGVFHDAGYKGLYGGLGTGDLKDRRGLGKNEDLLDHMGRAELAANDFRITQTEEKLRRERISTQQRAIDAHKDVGRKVRQTMKDIGGTLPENMPVEESIKPLLDKEKREQLNDKKGRR